MGLLEKSTNSITTMSKTTMSSFGKESLSPAVSIINEEPVPQKEKIVCKLYPNRVIPPWYRRYADILPGEEASITIQPVKEIQDREFELAMIFTYGNNWKKVVGGDLRKKDIAIVRYNRYKMQREKQLHEGVNTSVEAQPSSTLLNAYGITQREKGIVDPIIEFIYKLMKKSIRDNINRGRNKHAESKWLILHNKVVRAKLKLMADRKREMEIRKRVKKIFRMVFCVQKFVNVLSLESGSTSAVLKNVTRFQKEMEEKLAQDLLNDESKSKKKVFDTKKFRRKSVKLDTETELLLTKPWFERSKEEIEKIVKELQSLRTFATFPEFFQRIVARGAWYLNVPNNKVIIRQGHEAQDYYILLGGQATVTELKGNPYYKEKSNFSFVKLLQHDQDFGQECISNPGCLRLYSVMAKTDCQVLSLNVHDYNSLLMNIGQDEVVAEHMRLLGDASFMKNFPKDRLMFEGEENTTIFYFKAHEVVTPDVANSVFVYLVFYGTCLVYFEELPKQTYIDRHKERIANGQDEDSFKSSGRYRTMMGPFGIQTFSGSVPRYSAELLHLQNAMNPYSITSTQAPGRLKGSISQTEKTVSTVWGAMSSAGDVHRQQSGHLYSPRCDSQTCLKPSLSISRETPVKLPDISHKSEPAKVKSIMKIKDNSISSKLSSVKIQDPIKGINRNQSSKSNDHPRLSIQAKTEKEKKLKDFAVNKHKYSKFVHKRTMIRGDFIGVEYIDFENDIFTPPTGKYSIVSEGCVLIMIKKDFIKKYLVKKT